jgi:L-ascorbate metabolism protein UlaG (beta-lactamase superfamily)
VKISVISILPAVLITTAVAINPSACLAEDSSDLSDALTAPLNADEAVVWYLLHCGFAVRTQSKLLIFDYIHKRLRAPEDTTPASLANGRINPAEIADLDVYVFVTHEHTDHFDETIFNWRDSIPGITYFFGWEASDNPADHNMIGPRATYADDNIEVYTINSHHSGVPEVAYLVKTDSLVIYHGGDYNQDYEADIPYLKQFAPKVDIAMLDDWCGGPIMAVLEQLSPSLVFPQHFGGDEASPRKIPACVAEKNLPIRVESAQYRGEMFRY